MKDHTKSAFLHLQKNMQDMVRSLRPVLEMQKAMGAVYSDPIFQIQNKMQDMVGPSVLEMQKAMGIVYMDPIFDIQKKMHDMVRSSSPVIEMQKAMGTVYSDPIFQIQNKMQDLLANTVDSISSFSQFIKKLPKEEVIFNRDQSISCGTETLHISGLQEMVSQILDDMGFIQKNNTLDYYVNKIIIEIQKLKQPFIKKIITLFIMHLIVALVISLFNPAINKLSNHYVVPNNQIAKYIKKKISKSNIYLTLPKEYRIVIVDNLNVRAHNRKDSKLIDIINFGQIVRVINKKKNWTLIEYKCNEDYSEVIIKGWVFSRYIRKL